ncbi:MAG: hypothetical protein R2769_04585 [Saprospiraceae bacterium]
MAFRTFFIVIAFFYFFHVSAQGILFVGNSIFTDKEIPQMVKAYFSRTEIRIGDISKNGYSINRHLKDINSLKELNNNNWNIWIVLGLNKNMENLYMNKLDSIRGDRDVQIILIQPWTYYRPIEFRKKAIKLAVINYENLINNYEGVQLFRLGETLDCLLDKDPSIEFFYDNIHPNVFCRDIILNGIMKKIIKILEFQGVDLAADQIEFGYYIDCIQKFD